MSAKKHIVYRIDIALFLFVFQFFVHSIVLQAVCAPVRVSLRNSVNIATPVSFMLPVGTHGV